MESSLKIANPLNYNGWDEKLLASRECTIFHSTAWAKVLSETYQCHPVYFILPGKDKFSIIVPVMEIKSRLTGYRGVSLPFTDYCDPIINNEYTPFEIISAILKHGKEVGWKYYEQRGINGFDARIIPSINFYRHVLVLDKNYENLYRNLKESYRRNIKKSIKGNVIISIHNSIASMKEFFRLQCITRKRHGLPPQPYEFFKKIHEHVISKDYGMIIFASYNGSKIAGAVFLHFGDKVIYKFGASEIKYQHLRANNLIMWEAIKTYAEKGYKNLSLGRTSLYNEGLRRFKLGWGSKEDILHYYRYNLIKEQFVVKRSNETGIHNTIFRNMPIVLSRFIGSKLYKHHG